MGCTTSQLDVASGESISKFKEQYGDRPLDLLLNVAGMKASPITGSRRERERLDARVVADGAHEQEWQIRTTTHSPP